MHNNLYLLYTLFYMVGGWVGAKQNHFLPFSR